MAIAKAKVTTPNQNAVSEGEPVKLPTSSGNTGMIRPIDTMSISTVIRMKGMAATRARGGEVIGSVFPARRRRGRHGSTRPRRAAVSVQSAR